MLGMSCHQEAHKPCIKCSMFTQQKRLKKILQPAISQTTGVLAGQHHNAFRVVEDFRIRKFLDIRVSLDGFTHCPDSAVRVLFFTSCDKITNSAMQSKVLQADIRLNCGHICGPNLEMM